MFETTIHTLSMLKSVLYSLPKGCYKQPCACLSQATLGQHTRHIIELYQCLLLGYDESIINYDNRKRDKRIETDLEYAIEILTAIQETIKKPDKRLTIGNQLNNKSVNVSSTYFREVLYNLEHTIHHQALLRVGIESLCSFELPEEFGVAPSTINYRAQCAP